MLLARRCVRFGIQERDASRDYLSGVVFFAWGLFPHARLQRSLDTDEPAFAQILIAMLCGLSIRHDSVPLRGFLRVAVCIVPVIVRRDAEAGNLRPAAGHAVFRIPAQPPDQNDLVYASHCPLPSAVLVGCSHAPATDSAPIYLTRWVWD